MSSVNAVGGKLGCSPSLCGVLLLQAATGQVWVTGAVWAAANAQLHGRVHGSPMGAHQLKGISDKVELWTVR